MNNDCEHEDFSIGDTIVDKDIYEDDKLVVSKVKCDICGKDGMISELHYNINSDEDHWIEGETNFDIRIEDEMSAKEPKDRIEQLAKQIVSNLNDRNGIHIDFDDKAMAEIYREIAMIIATEMPKILDSEMRKAYGLPERKEV